MYTQGHGLFPRLAASALGALFIYMPVVTIVMRRSRRLLLYDKWYMMIDGDGDNDDHYHRDFFLFDDLSREDLWSFSIFSWVLRPRWHFEGESFKSVKTSSEIWLQHFHTQPKQPHSILLNCPPLSHIVPNCPWLKQFSDNWSLIFTAAAETPFFWQVN